jgi:hypothetical protein
LWLQLVDAGLPLQFNLVLGRDHLAIRGFDLFLNLR